MSARHLLVDAGNTRLKWALLAGGLWESQGSADYADLPALAKWVPVRGECTIASVAGADRDRQLAALLSRHDIEPKWLTANAQFLDVRNTYVNPAQLGVDRWMGLIAARQRNPAATLVVSLGTALTVDALSADCVFLGGLIIPGRSLMQQSLRLGTAQIEGVDGQWQAFPQNTADAVQSGMVAAMSGAIHLQHARLAKQCGCIPLCLLTGGDAAMLMPYLDLPLEHVPLLVLQGIARVVNEGGAG